MRDVILSYKSALAFTQKGMTNIELSISLEKNYSDIVSACNMKL